MKVKKWIKFLLKMKEVKLHLGCGWRNFGKEWTHIDGGDYDHLEGDTITKLSYSNETVNTIYASHVFEYFDREEGYQLLKEWFRVLKPNGILRLAVPDFESLIRLYVEGKSKLNDFLGPLYGKMKMGENTIYHKTVYDYISLERLLKECGFKTVRLYDWKKTEHSNFDDHSQAYMNPKGDKENGVLISLNIEAIK